MGLEWYDREMSLDYISYSQYNSYTCPRSWYLSKIRQAEEKQTWYLPIGSAVHNMVEHFLDKTTPDLPPAEEFFYPLIEKQMKIEPDLSKWLAGGPKDAPVVEEKALQLVKDCFEKAIEELEDIDVWEVEFDATARLPELEVPVRAYIDIIGEHKKKGPVIVDWKTGSTKPGNFQLETYAALLRALKNPNKFKGRYIMLAPGSANTRYVDLSEIDPAEVGRKYQQVYDQMKQKIYKANPGFNCRFCFNQDNCLVNAGPTPRAKYYDRSREDGLPF